MSSNHRDEKGSQQPVHRPDAEERPTEPAARRLRLEVPSGLQLRLILTGMTTEDPTHTDSYDEFMLSIPEGEDAFPQEYALDGSGAMLRPIERGPWWKRMRDRIRLRAAKNTPSKVSAGRLASLLFALALLVYASSRLIRIADYPSYFLTDEANQANLAADLVRDDYRDYEGVLLPTYFKNVYEYNLSLSVYLQLLPVRLFGKSVAATRAAPALVTVIGAAAVGLTLSLLTGRRRAWLGVLIFGLSPAWFLHSRTAFETSLMVSCYACFVYTYLLYRVRSPRFISLTLVFAALTFYSYAPGQAVIVLSTLVLLVADWRYHRSQLRILALNLPLLVALVLPYLRFQWLYPGKHTEALRILGSYWLQDLPLSEKIHLTLINYLGGLNPAYWLTPNQTDLARHQMDSFGYFFAPAFPLLLLGLALALRRRRLPAERTVLLALLIIPAAGIPAGIGITRVLALIVPATLLSSSGLSWLMDRAPAQPAIRHTLSIAIFTLLSGLQAALLMDALARGPIYSQDYGMNGMQWGARQVFGRIESMLDENPDQLFLLSPTWANGVDVLRRFFLPDDSPVQIANAAGYLENKLDLAAKQVFILTRPEVEELDASPKIGRVDILDQIEYPNGFPGFTFLRLEYAPNADEIFAAEVAERRRPRNAAIMINGVQTQIEFPYLDIGGVELMFDHDPYTLARVYEANPARIVLTFEQPRDIQGLRLTTGSMNFELKVTLLDSDSTELAALDETYNDLPDDPTVELESAGRIAGVRSVTIEILSLTSGDPFKIHIREIELY